MASVVSLQPQCVPVVHISSLSSSLSFNIASISGSPTKIIHVLATNSEYVGLTEGLLE